MTFNTKKKPLRRMHATCLQTIRASRLDVSSGGTSSELVLTSL